MTQRPKKLETLLKRLAPSLGNRLRTDSEALEAAASDESGLPAGEPGGVAKPLTTEEVVTVAREAASTGVALVPRGAGTGKAGGCIPGPGELVVDLSGMNEIKELRTEDLYAVVEPGVITRDLDLAAMERGYFYPPDPASLESCTLGGNIATNAGGARALKYGVTQRYVWGLEVVLPGGELIRIGRRSIKGVAGLDLTSLLVGSEGTLGFITQAVLHIIPAPKAVETAWLSFPDPLTASRVAEKIFSAGFMPRMMEMLDREAIDAVRPVSKFVIPPGIGAAVLLEVDGREGEALEELIRVAELAAEQGATDSAVARNERDREAMRRARRLVSSRLKENYPFKMSDDIAVPRSRMPELLERAGEVGAAEGVVVSAYGHLGDGNLHVNFLCKTETQRLKAKSVRQRVISLALEMGGTVSGEHGIGLSKRDILPLELGENLIDLQRRLKTVFDPNRIMNPGKVWS